jgi:hypothetical protein
MPTFTWTVPSSPSSTPSPPSSRSLEPTDILFGLLDQDLDPVTHDYVDTADGAWAETATSRTAVQCQLSTRFNSWPRDPDMGTQLQEWLENGVPITPAMVIDDTRRALQLVVEDGLIADLEVEIGSFDIDAGALEVECTYTDVLAGYVVELTYSPF